MNRSSKPVLVLPWNFFRPWIAFLYNVFLYYFQNCFRRLLQCDVYKIKVLMKLFKQSFLLLTRSILCTFFFFFFATLELNFINIFTYKFFVWQLFLCTCDIHVTRKKLPKRHSYEKNVKKMLVKLTPDLPLPTPTILAYFVFCFSLIIQMWSHQSHLRRHITSRRGL